MNRLACLLALVLVVCLSASAAQLVLGPLEPGGGAHAVMDLPITVKTGDGVELEKGQYRVVVQQPLLRQARGSVGSLGFWTGPVVHISPMRGVYPAPVFVLKTAFEVRLVHPVPQTAPRQQQVQQSEIVVTPYIRDGELIGIFHDGRILYITEASSRFRPGYRFFRLPRP